MNSVLILTWSQISLQFSWINSQISLNHLLCHLSLSYYWIIYVDHVLYYSYHSSSLMEIFSWLIKRLRGNGWVSFFKSIPYRWFYFPFVGALLKVHYNFGLWTWEMSQPVYLLLLKILLKGPYWTWQRKIRKSQWQGEKNYSKQTTVFKEK